MDAKVKALLEEEIKTEIDSLEDMEFGSEEHKVAVDTVAKLLDKLNDMERIESEYLEKSESRTVETDLKIEQMEEEKKDRIIKNCLMALGTLSSIGLTIWGTNKTLKFEETGTVTTMAGRAFIQKLFPKK